MATATKQATEQLSPGQPARRPTRADARRNYDALLVAADAAFQEKGVEASLEEIARQAGVAIGTLYRHFPAREALLEAIFHDEFDNLRRRAEELLGDPSPADALLAWVDALSAHAATYRGLAQSILASFDNEASALYAAHQDMQEFGGRLLARAQDAGEIRADIDIGHVTSLVCGLGSAVEKRPDDPEYGRQLRRILYDGLRVT